MIAPAMSFLSTCLRCSLIFFNSLELITLFVETKIIQLLQIKKVFFNYLFNGNKNAPRQYPEAFNTQF
jgi:hypothetical protein